MNRLTLLFLAFIVCTMTVMAANAPAPSWIVAGFTSPAPGNVFFNNEPVALQVTVKAKSNQPLAIKGGTWRIKEMEEIWPYPWNGQNERFRIGQARMEGTVPATTADKITVDVAWPVARLGAYGLFLQLDDGTGADEQMVCGLTVVYPPTPGRKLNSPIVFNLYGQYITWHAPAFQRLGAKWVRWETSWGTNEPQPGKWKWDETDGPMEAARKNDLYIMAIMAHAPNWAVPMFEGRKIITYAGGNKPETNVSPANLAQWQEWARRYVERYHDVVRAGIVLNEPWEGGSISGWHGNGAHYRNMLRAFFAGTHAADRTFTVLANDSGMNAEDNILCDTGAIQYVDAVSVHTYRSYLGYYTPQYMNYGKPVWDTESWNGVGESENIYQCVLGLSQGMVKMQPCSIEDIVMDCNKPSASWVTPTGQALSTLLHFIEDTELVGEPRPECAPWMVVFRGQTDSPTPQKNAAVIWGRDRKWRNDPFSQVTHDGTLTLTDPKKELTAYDVKGNPLPRNGNSVIVPLNTSIYYLVSSKGAVDLMQRLRVADIQGLETVQVALHDFTRPLDQKPALRVTVANITNVPLTGTVNVTAPAGWEVEKSRLLTVPPGASTELAFAVTATKAIAINRYPFTVEVKTNKGTQKINEELSVTVFAHGTPPLDGKAEDWQALGAVPVYLTGKPVPVDSFLQYAFPFMNLKAQDNTGYFAGVMGMWDENNFYLAADVNDPKAVLRPSMTGTWYAMHAAPNDWEYWMNPAFPGTSGDMVTLAFNVLPYGQKQIANFPPEAQQVVPFKWRVNPADYEIALYQARKLSIPDGDYAKSLEDYMKLPGNGGLFRQPTLVEDGQPIPEVWRLMAPGTPRHNYFPSSPRQAKDQGIVPGAKLVVTRDGDVWHYRAAIPWSELELVKPIALAGGTAKFTFTCKNDGNTALQWAQGRSVSRISQELMHPTWEELWSPDTEWGFVENAK